jgi:16S rRNA (guanine527-N7)-methyltransferase
MAPLQEPLKAPSQEPLMANLTELIEAGLTELDLQRSDRLVEGLQCLLEQLIKWNRVYNLTAIKEAEQIIERHFLDSLSVHRYFTGVNIIDVGSGGGFPGLPLALYYPSKNFTLLDSNGKKTRFLQQMKVELGMDNCQIVHSRVETYENHFDQVTCRAFASLAGIIKNTGHMLSINGEILALKGKLEVSETREDLSPFKIEAIHNLTRSRVGGQRHLVVLRKID